MAACEGLPRKRIWIHTLARAMCASRIAIEGVEHHRGVDASEGTGVEQPDLAAAALLRGRADEIDRAREGIALPREREERAQRAARDEVVPAGVSDLGERVVLGEDGDLRPCAAADARAEGGGEAAEAPLDGHARGLHGLGDPRGGAVLLVTKLRCAWILDETSRSVGATASTSDAMRAVSRLLMDAQDSRCAEAEEARSAVRHDEVLRDLERLGDAGGGTRNIPTALGRGVGAQLFAPAQGVCLPRAAV